MSKLAALTPLIDLVFPPRCPLCGDALGEQGGLCIACWSKLVIPGEPACALCQRPMGDAFGGDSGALMCAPCLQTRPKHDGIAAATLYNPTSRDLVLAFKHGRRVALGALLGRLIAARVGDLAGEWLVVPVQLHRWRLWKRGFNQSALLARRSPPRPDECSRSMRWSEPAQPHRWADWAAPIERRRSAEASLPTRRGRRG